MRSVLESLAAVLRPEMAVRHCASPLLGVDALMRARRWRVGRVEPWFAFGALLGVPEVETILAAHGVDRRDLEAVTSQLLEDVGVSDEEPSLAPEIERAFQASVMTDGRSDFASYLRAIGDALPPPYAIARAALHRGAARAIAEEIDRPLSRDANGNLTLEGWAPKARNVVGMAQALADRFSGFYLVEPEILLYAALSVPEVAPMLTGRGLTLEAIRAEVDVRKAAREAEEGLEENRRAPRRKERGEPTLVGLRFHTVLVRAERLAAEDRCDVTVGHLLAALRAHDFMRAIIDRMDL